MAEHHLSPHQPVDELSNDEVDHLVVVPNRLSEDDLVAVAEEVLHPGADRPDRAPVGKVREGVLLPRFAGVTLPVDEWQAERPGVALDRADEDVDLRIGRQPGPEVFRQAPFELGRVRLYADMALSHL